MKRTFQNLRLFAASSVLDNVMTAAQQHYKYSFEAVSHLKMENMEKVTKDESMELLRGSGWPIVPIRQQEIFHTDFKGVWK